MSLQRVSVLTVLAGLTVAFLGSAAYVLLGNPLRHDSVNVPALTVDEAPAALRLTVDKTGVFVITVQDLQRANFPHTSFTAEDLSLTHNGRPVPFIVEGSGKDARLYFYAEAITRSMEAPAVYWLSQGQGQMMARRDATPTGPGQPAGWRYQRWEENSQFKPEATSDGGWLGPVVYAPGSLDFLLTNIQPTGGPGRLVLRVWSGNQSPSYPDHHLEIYLNSQRLTSYRWDGKQPQTITIPIPAGMLQADSNDLLLRVPGDTDITWDSIYIDWIALEYEGLLNQKQGQLRFQSSAANVRVDATAEGALILDITDREEPILLTNVQYGNTGSNSGNSLYFTNGDKDSVYLVAHAQQAYVPQITLAPGWEVSLRSASWGADYIAIVPMQSGLPEVVQPLLDYRETQGLRVVLVPLEQIYDEFAFGRQTPTAIRDFIRHAYNEWEAPSPRFVLLVGDASYDLHNYTRGERHNLLPSPMVFTDFAGYVASDTWFSLLSSGELLPGLAVGRFPVQNREQLDVMVQKTLSYEQSSSDAAAADDWRRQALLVADDEGRFNTLSNRIATQLESAGFQPHSFYMTENEYIRDAIISTVNQGIGLLNYAGHGNPDVWGDEMVLRNSDVGLLLNGDRMPVFTTFTSLNGLFNHPGQDSLAETMLWQRNGGIVAAVAPSGRTFSWQQAPISEKFYTILVSEQGTSLGETLLQTKVSAMREPHLNDAVHAFNLLGDPALRVYIPETATEE